MQDGGVNYPVKITVYEYVDKNTNNKVYSIEAVDVGKTAETKKESGRANADVKDIRHHYAAFNKMIADILNKVNNVSKVRDDNGEPLAVYHGTPNGQFKEFGKEKRTVSAADSNAFWFSSNKSVAKTYGNTVYPVFLNIKKNMSFEFDFNTQAPQEDYQEEYSQIIEAIEYENGKGIYDGAII